MATTIDQVYEKTIRPLPMPDRLRLATKILQDIAPADRDTNEEELRALVELSQMDEGDEEGERVIWQAMSAPASRALWDNPIDAADWDDWQPSKPETKARKAGTKA